MTAFAAFGLGILAGIALTLGALFLLAAAVRFIEKNEDHDQ